MDPGLSDVFAAHAAKHDFDEVHEVHVRDGGDLEIPGYAFAPVFSIWTTIEECLNPPIVWEDGDWHTTEPFSAPEPFPFPEGIGPVECVNVEHEEVLLVPRWIETRKATFKYALGDDFIDKLKTIHALGMDRTDKVSVKGVEVAPRDVLAAIMPDPISLGDKFRGRAVVGTWVPGTKDGAPRETFAYQMADAEDIGADTASRWSVGRPGSTRSSRWSCWRTAPGPAPASWAPRRSTPIPTWRSSTATASTTPLWRWSREPTGRPERGYSSTFRRAIVASILSRISASSPECLDAQSSSPSGPGGIGCWRARSWNGCCGRTSSIFARQSAICDRQ